MTFKVKDGIAIAGSTFVDGSLNVSASTITATNATLSGELRGPASFVIDPAGIGDNTGTVVIRGNLQVDGTTTTINSTTVSIDDLNITLADGAASAAAANGAGITIAGANATFNYASSGDKWQANKSIETSSQLISTVATGTAPLVITSTTTVSNLNADLLDGQHGSYYAPNASLSNYLPLAGGTMTGAINLNNFNLNNANRVGIGTASPGVSLAISATDAVLLPKGTTAQRPTGVSGYLRYNTETNAFEGHNGSTWGSIGGGVTVGDNAPSSPIAGALWWDSDNGRLKIYYNDGDTLQWVDANPTPSSAGIGIVSGTAPTSLVNGLLWLDSTQQVLKVYYNDGVNPRFISSSGIPTGGTTGQALTKSSASDYAMSWTDVVTPTGTQTLTNKTISGASNTLSNIPNAALTNSSVTVGTTAISLGSSATTITGLTSVTSTTFVGALSGNASTATTLQTARTINGVSFNGSANITITAANPNALTIGTGLSGTSYDGSSAVTIAIDSTVATLTGTQTLTNKTINLANNTLTATSAQIASAVTDETGSGSLVFGTSPSFTTSVTTGSTSFDVFNTTATTVNAFGAATTLALGATTGTTTVRNSLVVTGDLTVNGTTTTINATTITVDDINIELGSVASPTDVTANGGGITLKGATDKTFNWQSATGAWTSSEDLNLATGKVYEINGTTVLSASALGTGVTSSSLTSVGTITSGTWSASFGAVSGANLTNLTAGNLTGTIPSTVLGNSTVNIGTTAVALNRASANLALTGISSIALPGATSGTVTLQPAATAGTTTITLPATTGTVITTGDSGTVTSTMIANDTIVNADISPSAAIAISKLAASTISGVSLGNNLNALTIGTGLSGTSYNGSSAVTISIDSTVATLTGTQTLTNKTISGASNTLSNIPNSALTNSSVTINGTAVSLGGSATVTASTTNALTIGTGLSGTSFNGGSAVTIAIDSTVATLTGTQTLTNKTLTSPTINGNVATTGINFDSNTLVIDATNNRVGIGEAAPSVSLQITATDAVLVPKGTTAQRPTGVSGYLRYNTETNTFEGHNGTAWGAIGGGGSISVSDTAPASPTAGALWWDSTIGRLKIYYNDGDTSQWVDAAPSPSSVGVSAVSDTAPTALVNGLLWWDSNSGTLKVYYNDGNTSQWVDANPAIQGPEGPQGLQGPQGPAGEDGDVTRGRAVAIAMIFG